MADAGLGAEDFRKRAAVPSLNRVDGHVESDPLKLALNDKRQILASKVLESSIHSSEAEAIKSENERLSALIEQQKLHEQVAGGSGKGEAWQEYILAEMGELRKELSEEQARRHEATVAALQERLAILNDEMGRIKERGSEPVDQLGQAITTLQSARSLVDLMHPPRPEREDKPAVGPGVDPSLRKWEISAEMEREQRRSDADDRRMEREEEWRLRRELAEKELALKQNESEARTRFFEATSPKVLEIVEKIFILIQHQPGPAVAPVAAATIVPGAQPPAAAPLFKDPNIRSMTCQCGQALYFRDEYTGVICTRCGAEYQNQPAPAATPEVANDYEADQQPGQQADTQSHSVTPGVY